MDRNGFELHMGRPILRKKNMAMIMSQQPERVQLVT